MKFGPVLVSDAQGAILAHSVAVQGKRLRKGRVLTAEDIKELTQAGHNDVTVAQLGLDDVHEDKAAERLANVLCGQVESIKQTNAFTGRVNLLAEQAGVALIDAAALNLVNAIHPMITVATVPPHQQMAAGGMIATIKMISYGVPEEALVQACRAAQNAIELATPTIAQAALIITEIPGGAGEKGRQAIEDRLNALNVELVDVQTVPHEPAILAQSIKAASAPLVLILTGSATSDIHDVAPLALCNAGGDIIRFGMPVDPGNLLFLGTLGAQMVIGLPGCARAPALNGADWVLSRIVCGIEVTSRDIAAMGVGGLLKEIPTRPQPRSGPGRKHNSA